MQTAKCTASLKDIETASNLWLTLKISTLYACIILEYGFLRCMSKLSIHFKQEIE